MTESPIATMAGAGTRRRVLNVFKPSSEITDPRAFSGRRSLILQLTDALVEEKSCPIIYGPRGLGKTSLAVQVARIALGDDTLLTEYGVGDRALSRSDCFTVFWASCSSATPHKDAILQRMINTAVGFSTLNEFESFRQTKQQTTTKLKLLKIYEKVTGDSYAVEQGSKYTRLSIEEELLKVIAWLYEHESGRLLFVIDELDRVPSTKGLASFIKNESTADLKFLLVGIGHDVSDLLAEHRSLERPLIQVRVPTMNDEELRGIIEKALSLFGGQETHLAFSEAAKNRLVRAAGGLPWFVHVLGQEALRRVMDSRPTRQIVGESDIEAAIENLASNRFAESLSDLYLRAVEESSSREVVLRLFAKYPLDDIPTSEIYRIAPQLGVRTPWTWTRALMDQRILSAAPMHEKGVVRFRDALFKRYVDIRASRFDKVREDVDRIWLAAAKKPGRAAS